MKKSIIIVLLAVFLIACGAAYAKDVIVVQKGPATAHKGENITVTYTVYNNGNQPIYNVTAADQDFYKFLGTINAGEKKSFTQKVYIPTDKEVQADFGPDATVSNPFFIGGVAITYQNASGKKFGINSNSLKIPLISSSGKVANKTVAANITDLTNATTTNASSEGIIQQIIDLINSIVQYVANMFVPNSN